MNGAKKLSIIFIILSLTEIHFIDCEKIKKGLLSAFSVVKVVPISLYKNTTLGTYNPKTTYINIFFSSQIHNVMAMLIPGYDMIIVQPSNNYQIYLNYFCVFITFVFKSNIFLSLCRVELVTLILNAKN